MRKKFALSLITLMGVWMGIWADVQGEVDLRFWPSRPSRRDLLNLSGKHGEEGKFGAFPQVDTLRILAVRAQFQPDSLATTTGDGRFDLTAGSDEKINPPPHDRLYFERQLRALQSYFAAASNGRLILTYRVFPRDNDSSYTLPHNMAHYNPGTTEAEVDKRLAQFLRDAITVADISDTISFGDYDSYIVFHAGVGADISLFIDPTPQDIPSAFFNLDDLRDLLGASDIAYKGIPVQDSSFFVTEGMWLPETENQEGYEFGLTGPMANLFGHQLGLPNLFNTNDGMSGIGKFGLMDQGAGNGAGLIPALPCAWSRAFLGWVDPLVVVDSSGLKIAASTASGGADVVKVSINSKEYFLVENRQRDINGDDTVVVQKDRGVVISVDEYDWDIPGSGVLIWHIDEEVIEDNLAANMVNGDPLHRGVDLEEADGFQEIGHIVSGFYVTYGTDQDLFYEGNNTSFTPYTKPDSRSNSGAYSHISITNIGPSDSLMTLDVSSNYCQPGWPRPMASQPVGQSPSFGDLDGDGFVEVVASAENGTIFAWRADGSKLISNADSALVVRPGDENTWVQIAIFAQVDAALLSSPLVAHLDRDGAKEVIVGTADGEVYAWRGRDNDGDGRADAVENFPVTLSSGPITFMAMADVDSATGGVEIIAVREGALPAVLNPIGGIICDSSLAGDEEASHTVYTGAAVFQDVDGDGIDEIALGASEIPDRTKNFVEIYDLAHGREGVIRLDSHGQVTHLAAGDIDHDGKTDIVGVTGSGALFAGRALGDSTASWVYRTNDTTLSSPALGDIDDDGYLEIVVAGNNRVYAFNYSGALVTNWPILIDRARPVGAVLSSPIMGDIDGEPGQEVIVGSPESTSTGQLLAYRLDGRLVEDWPLSCGEEVNTTPALLDIDGDDDPEVMVGSEDGWLYLWDLPGSYEERDLHWPLWGRDLFHRRSFPDSLLPPPRPTFGELMPTTTVFSYPNPFCDATHIRYFLREPADVEIKIFDLAGNLVDTFDGPGHRQTFNERIWYGTNNSGRRVASGVYLCRVEAKSKKDSQVVFCKIAVVR